MDNVEVAALQKELEKYVLGLVTNHGEAQGSLHLIHKGNHLVWKGAYRDGYFALRMADPTHYRAGEWLSAGQEYLLLKDLEQVLLAVPRPHCMIYDFKQPFLMMEWVDGTPLNGFKETREGHFDAVARAIGTLASQTAITPERLPFIPRVSGVREWGNVTRYFRLLDACRRMPQRDVAMWAARIFPIVARVHYVLSKYRAAFRGAPWCFHHDGLHAGNVFIREDKSVVFLDWDKVSYRKNPVFTLARFASSLYPYGRIPAEVFLRLVRVFSEAFGGYDLWPMRHMAACMLLERLCADLVYGPWDFARNPANRGKKMPDSMHAALEMRLFGVRNLLADA